MRATLEAIAFEVRDVVDLMTREAGVHLPELAVDGGAAANDLLCQLQADQLRVPVPALRGAADHRTGRGVPRRAGHRGLGVPDRGRLTGVSAPATRRFEPAAPATSSAPPTGGGSRWSARRGWARLLVEVGPPQAGGELGRRP